MVLLRSSCSQWSIPLLALPAVLGSQLERKWCQWEEQSEVRVRTSDAFCLSALGKTAAFGHREISRTGCPLLRSVECMYHAYISPAYLPVSFPWESGISLCIGTLLVTCLPCTALWSPNYTHSPVEKEPNGDVCFLLKLLWPSSFLTRFQTLFSREGLKMGSCKQIGQFHLGLGCLYMF